MGQPGLVLRLCVEQLHSLYHRQSADQIPFSAPFPPLQGESYILGHRIISWAANPSSLETLPTVP